VIDTFNFSIKIRCMKIKINNVSGTVHWELITLILCLCALAAFAIHKIGSPFAPNVDIKTDTMSYHPTTIKDGEGRTLVAEMESPQEFERSDKMSWLNIYLGTTSSKIKCTATFRYYVDNSGTWELKVKNGICTVNAPPYLALPKTSFDSSTLEKYTKGGWARFNKDENLKTLEMSMTGELDKRSETKEMRELVRDKCRKSVEDLSRQWLKLQGYEDKILSIKVVFPDEVKGNGESEPHTPSSKLVQ
jgi:hypothetical protein